MRIGLPVVALLLAGCGHDASHVSSGPPLPTLQVRRVDSSAAGPCHVAPLTTAAGGSACDAAGTFTYVLGPSLADLQPVSARFDTDELGTETFLDVHLDRRSADRFAEVSGDSLGRQVAFLLGGRVLSAPVIQARIDGDLQITGDAAVLRAVGRTLRAAPAPSRTPDAFSGHRPRPFDVGAVAAQQERVCGAARPRLAPGSTGNALGLVGLPTTAAETASLLASEGDRQGAAYWRQQPPADLVYQCSYASRPGPTPPVPSCPPGQSPVMGEPAGTTEFFVDARGHATVWRPPYPSPAETCSPD